VPPDGTSPEGFRRYSSQSQSKTRRGYSSIHTRPSLGSLLHPRGQSRAEDSNERDGLDDSEGLSAQAGTSPTRDPSGNIVACGDFDPDFNVDSDDRDRDVDIDRDFLLDEVHEADLEADETSSLASSISSSSIIDLPPPLDPSRIIPPSLSINTSLSRMGAAIDSSPIVGPLVRRSRSTRFLGGGRSWGDRSENGEEERQRTVSGYGTFGQH
jgi:hypothetical protein